MAELGLVGVMLLTAFLVAVGTGLFRTARAARGDPLARTIAVAAGGGFVGWLTQTSVDWLHLFPGLTAVALGAALALRGRPSLRPVLLVSRSHLIAIAVVAAVTIAGALAIVPRVLALHSRTLAQNALAQGRPRIAVAEATRALSYEPRSVQALILRAAGLARLHAFAPTLADLRQAMATEPDNWVTWALLGDLLTRRGEPGAARAAYAHALRLNPLEPGLRAALGTNASRSR